MRQRRMRTAQERRRAPRRTSPLPREELANLVVQAEAEDVVEAVAVQAEAGREHGGDPVGQSVAEGGAEVMRGVVQTGSMAVAEAAIHFHTGDEVLWREGAGTRDAMQRQRMRGCESVAKLPRLIAQVFFEDQVFGEVPCVHVAGEDEFQLGLALLLGAAFMYGGCEIRGPVMADDLEQALVGAVRVLQLGVEDGIDPVLAQQRPEAVFEPEAGEGGGFLSSGLAVKVKF